MSEDLTLDKALGAPKESKPQKGGLSLDQALGPDKSPRWKREIRDAKASIKDVLSAKTATNIWKDSAVHGLLTVIQEAGHGIVASKLADQGHPEELKKMEQIKKEKRLQAEIDRGFAPDKTEMSLKKSFKENIAAGKELVKETRGDNRRCSWSDTRDVRTL